MEKGKGSGKRGAGQGEQGSDQPERAAADLEGHAVWETALIKIIKCSFNEGRV